MTSSRHVLRIVAVVLTVLVLILGLTVMLCKAFASAQQASPPASSYLFFDDFNGDSLDPAMWNVVLGNGCPDNCGWGNAELECYTAGNFHVMNGSLLIYSTFHQENTNCYDGNGDFVGTTNWTSAKLNTQGKMSLAPDCDPVFVEAKIKVPTTMGSWPAFWMLPEKGAWCQDGEIDVMKHKNNDSEICMTTWYSSNKNECNHAHFAQNISNVNDWHVYRVEWGCDYITWNIDGIDLYTWDYSTTPFTGTPFTKSFYIILNLAIGGNFPGDTVDIVESVMAIDYVKAYW